MSLHLNLRRPKTALNKIVEKLGRKRPVARLMKETGRASSNPVFLVGIYSGTEKIGEGYGSSLEMAEERGCKDALRNYYLKELKEIELPEVDEEDSISFFEESVKK